MQHENEEWVECVSCAKWRIVPRGVDPKTLKEDWKCSDGAAWRTTGLCCTMDEDVCNDERSVVDAACHQPSVGSYLVKILPVTLQLEEEAWLRSVCGLRPCYCWNDGYSAYRWCAAANRGSTKQEMIEMLLHFWGYTRTKRTYEPGNTYETVPPYKHRDLGGDSNEQQLVFTEAVAKTNIALLRSVAVSLTYGKNSHLNKRYFCPETFFESLAVIDSICLIIINTLPENDQPRYRV